MRAVRGVASIDRDGLPNYFDDQRFGSVGFAGGFIAEAWLKGDHETALKLAIVEPTASDRPETREEKAILREFWGRWAEAKSRLPRSHARSLVTYLADHPTDFRGAFARVRRDLRSIYFSAYQSFLWNLALGRLIEAKTRPDQRVAIDFKVATLPLHHDLDPQQADDLRRWTLPLPASRTPLAESGEASDIVLGGRRRAGPGVERPSGQAPEGRLLLQGGTARRLSPDVNDVRGRRRRALSATKEGPARLRPAQGMLRHPRRQAMHQARRSHRHPRRR